MQKYKSNITTTSGAAVRNVPVHVLKEDGAPASLFLDRDGHVAAPNPLKTGPDGTFYFYAVNGRYGLRTTVDGVTITDDDVVLLMDPQEITVAGPIAEAVAAAQAAAVAAEFAVEGSGIPELVTAAQNAVIDANAATAQAAAAATLAESAKTDATAAKTAAEAAAASASAAGANSEKRVAKDGVVLRRAINSLRYAPVTENRQYAYTSLNAAKKTNTDGGSRTVWEPDGVGAYGAAWTRDQSMSMEGYLEYFGANEIKAIAEYFLSKSNLATGEVPDHVGHTGTVYWTPGTANNWGSRAPVDGNTYLLQMFWLHFVKTGSAALYNTHKVALKGLIETGIPYNATTGCVTISDASPFVGFGFYDTVKATGDVLFPSVLAYRAFLQLAELEFALGNTAETVRLHARADTIKNGINTTLLNYYDIEFGAPNYVRKLAFYKASTIKCSGQLDMWGTMFAVWSGIPEEGVAKMIASNLNGIITNSSASTDVATTHKGAVRHVVRPTDYAAGQSWEAYFAAPAFGTYQNGGFWHTATPWMCYALSLVDPAAAKVQYDAMIASMREQSDAVRPVEWLMNTGATLGAGKYATSAIAPLMCGDLMPYSAGGSAGVGVPAGGTAGQVLAKVDATDYNTVWVPQSGGSGSGDIVAALVNTEVSITASVTLTASAFGKMHVCNGTTANYTVVLPPVAGNAGKIIGFRMTESLRCFVTIDGNASEQIDGQFWRVMWRNESAILLCDGTSWIKIAGKAVPMSIVMLRGAVQSVNKATWTKISMDTVVRDNTAGSVTPCVDLVNGYFVARRVGLYQASGLVTFRGVPANTEVNGGVGVNSASPTDNPNAFSATLAAPSTGYVHVGGSGTFECEAGHSINVITYINIGTGAYNTRPEATVRPTLSVVEIPTW